MGDIAASQKGNRSGRRRSIAAIAIVIIVVGVGAFSLVSRQGESVASANAGSPPSSQSADTRFQLTAPQWTSLTVEPVTSRTFREELVTEGKIAIDEEHSTSVFSPYSGRVTRLLAIPGDQVEAGQPLLVLEASEALQAQNDFISASTAANKARSQAMLSETVERRLRNLYDTKAVALRELQQAQADLTAAQNDHHGTKTALEAARNRLKILGKSDSEIDALLREGAISPETILFAPLSGTVVQRKIGPGQYVSSGSSDPIFVVGDLSTVWLVAFVRESDAGKVKVGQPVSFSVLAHPGRSFQTKIDYVSPSIDPSSRRRMVRATVSNAEGLFAPEMFATVKVFVAEEGATASIPREAIIYENSTARVWVVNDDRSIELRSVKLGLSDGRSVQVLDGVEAGQKVISRGSLFIDRLASGPRS